MRTSTQILPGIKSIGWVDCRHLAKRVALSGICGMPVAIFTDIHPIDFFGDAECRCTTKRDSNGYEDTASLKFLSDKALPLGIALGFIVTDVNDKSYLIGSLEPPRPKVEVEHRSGSPSGDGAGFQYEIKHTALKSMIPCII